MASPIVKCPTCGEAHPWSSANRYRPFCSERCKKIDLGAWASEAYRVPVVPGEDESEGEMPPLSGADWQ